MKDKILAFLKTKLAGFAGGVEEGFLLEYADYFSKSITEEKQIDTTITDGVIDNIKVAYGFYNKEVSKKTAAAQQTALKNFQEKHGLNEDGTPIKKPVGRPSKTKDDDSDPDEPAWFTAFKKEQADSVAALKSKIEKQEQEKTLAVLSEKVKAHEKLKDIPAWYLKKCNLVPESEDKIEQLAISIETDWNEAKQFEAERGVIISVPPEGGGPAGDKVTIEDYLKDKFPEE